MIFGKENRSFHSRFLFLDKGNALGYFTMTARKRVSKKLKKSWRKNCDTTDVDQYLDNKRLEERLG